LNKQSNPQLQVLDFFILFFILAPHAITYTNGYLLERLRIDCLLFVVHSRSIGMQFKWLGLSIQKNIQPFEQLLLFFGKIFSSFRTTAVFNSKFKAIQPFEQQRFSIRQRMRLDSAFCDALDLPTSLCWHIFQRYCSTDVKIFVVSFIFTTQKSTNKMPKQNFSLGCQVVSNLDTMGLRNIKTCILWSASFPSSHKCNIEYEPSI